MDSYRMTINEIGARRREGQCFLVDKSIAQMEANYAKGMRVVELGAGLGILTRELCAAASHVLAVEKDRRLFQRLSGELEADNLTLVNADFFELEIERKEIDLMVSNIPYNLSSKVISWLGDARIPAVLCVQKEFAEHMVAIPSTRSYSRLSVEASLRFGVHHIRDIAPTSFYPTPKVSSSLIYIVPKRIEIAQGSNSVIRMIMNHKKKTLRNALLDSSGELGLEREEIKRIAASTGADSVRVFTMTPEQILEVANKVSSQAGL